MMKPADAKSEGVGLVKNLAEVNRMTGEAHWLTLTEAAELIRSREMSPVELTTKMLDRVAALDGTLHAYITLTADRAMAHATTAASEIAAGRYRGPLHGIPIGIKDLCDTQGVPTAAGTAVLRDHVPTEDATVVKRLENAGAIMLGKLALTEGAFVSHHPSVPVPVNPWNAERWSGASSSGSGVATAAALCFGSLGSDTGGSIRFPSAACGIVGLKPTWGRVSRHGVFPLAASLDHIGPMTRSVADAAAMLQVIAGFDARDPTTRREPVPDYTAALGRSLDGLRIGVDEAYVTRSMDPEVASIVLRSGEVLTAAGAQLATIRFPDVTEAVSSWTIICAPEAAVAHAGLYPERADEYGPGLAPLLDAGRGFSAMDYAKAHEARLRFCGELAGVFENVDLVLCPSMGVATPSAGLSGDDAEALATLLRFTAAFDFSGSPTISLPCGFTADGMPVSLQLIGRHLDEASLLTAASAYERSTDWHTRRPPLAP
jgi:amidase